MPKRVQPNEKAVELLTGALRDPFDFYLPDDGYVHAASDWLRYVHDTFMLWSFNPDAFAALSGGGPSTYPLAELVAGILRDEHVSDVELLDDMLVSELDARRCALARQQDPQPVTIDAQGTHLPFGPRSSMLRFVSILPEEVDFTNGDPTGSHSPYEDIGLGLIERIDAIRAAMGTQSRDAANRELDEFLVALGLPGRRGAPERGPSKKILKPLHSQGRELVNAFVSVGQVEQSATALQIFERCGVVGQAVPLWSARLILPMFSLPEIITLRERCSRRGPLTPSKFAMWVLEHRFGLRGTLARKLLGAQAGEEFSPAPNPIDELIARQGN